MTRRSYLQAVTLQSYQRGEDDLRLRLHWSQLAGEGEPGEVELTETARRVLAVVYLRIEGDGGSKLASNRVCLEVTLDAPLGDRRVYDGFTGQPLQAVDASYPAGCRPWPEPRRRPT